MFTVRDLAIEALPSAPSSFERPADLERVELLDAFAEHVHSFVDVSVLRPLSIVADTANGMGGLIAPRVFQGLPFKLEVLYGELDGTFPNHPADPIQPENSSTSRNCCSNATPTSVLRSTATPTASSSSTKRVPCCRVRRNRDRRQGDAREAPRRDRALQRHLLEDRA